MSLLRILVSLSEPALRCQWSFIGERGESVAGEGLIADLPQRLPSLPKVSKRAARVQLLIPAAQVLLTRARIPRGARRNAASVLAFAVEEKTVGDPAASQVSWLGKVDDGDALAVVDKPALARWRDAFAAAGIRIDEVQGETLLLPRLAGEWSMAWNGGEGFVRSGEFEGAVTDSGDRDKPPLSLHLMLDEARARGAMPTAIALYTTTSHTSPDATADSPHDCTPDLAAWQRELGIALRFAGPWDWRTAPAEAGIGLVQQGPRWRLLAGASTRLRPAAWILAAALTLHAIALVADWALLVNEQRALQQQMEARFRASFPDAVAVAAPALQMRRKLAEARHGAGEGDNGDFLPLLTQVSAAMKELPPGALRSMAYDHGQMTLDLASRDEAEVQALKSRLRQSGLDVEEPVSPAVGAISRRVLVLRPL